ncbi:hypothetical protein [Streptomyces sp. H39-S7]|uniref:hypothetical protein n=1 Tax=Streptomyces sp. H39-S7 TaxID=3004357 RepID=UPI0022B00EC9|nr:hypothetical protein [Streptomyces sp. H39-S7]MCZ4120230.1 hypothetical protein [Streptomyces sp. H39-S7]
MDAKTYTTALAELRTLRDDIKKAQVALAKLEAERGRRIVLLAGYDKAKADRIAPAAGLSLSEIVALAPALAPDTLAAAGPAAAAEPTEPTPTAPEAEPTVARELLVPGALAPALTPAASAAEAEALSTVEGAVPAEAVVSEPFAGSAPASALSPTPALQEQTGAPAVSAAGAEPSSAAAAEAVAGETPAVAASPAPAHAPKVTVPAAPEATAPPTTLPATAVAPSAAAPTSDPAPPAAPATAGISAVGAPERMGQPRQLPSLPVGPDGDRWIGHTPNLASAHPNFAQQARATVFLDTTTGVLVHRDQVTRLELGASSVGEILTAVFATVTGSVERIYVTAGDPWHRDAARYPYLKDAVTAWLNAPAQGWRADTGRGRDKMAGHFVHARHPVGRYQRDGGEQHVEIRSVGEWFEPAGASPAVVRDAFVMLWKVLRSHWSDAVLMGSPSQTGRDLWSRTIPVKGQFADGYPVLSEELRGLLHATAGQGRTQLLTPPAVPEQLPGLVEYDRTFAYAKHTWKSGVGLPRRITAATFAGWSEKEQTKALFGCGHWHLRVTVPHGWNHVGILPAPAPGERTWHYPATPGTTFTTWAGGPELYTALSNPIQPWHIEILDGLLWADGKPLDDWSTKLKDCWSRLAAQADLHADPEQRTAAHLASRAVRAILLYGIGAFAQRPRTVTGTTPRTQERDVPTDAEIIGFDEQTITWQRPTGFARDPFAHPEWAAGVWSSARAALLSMRMREDDTYVGALHTPPGTVVAFRTDAVYLTTPQPWPYHGQPGDYLRKGHLPGPVPAPATEDDLLTLRDKGRTHLAATRTGART